MNNRIDGYIVEKQVGRYISKKQGITREVKAHKEPYYSDYYYLAFSKKFYHEFPRVSQKVWRSIRNLRENESKELLESYFYTKK